MSAHSSDWNEGYEVGYEEGGRDVEAEFLHEFYDLMDAPTPIGVRERFDALHQAYNRQCEVALRLYELAKMFRELERDLEGSEGLPQVAAILVSPDEGMIAERWPLKDAFHAYGAYLDFLAHELDR